MKAKLDNLYQLDGRVPLHNAIPFGLQHVLAMNVGAILSVCLIFLVSAAETIGDTSALVSGGLNRKITSREIVFVVAFVLSYVLPERMDEEIDFPEDP